MKINGIDKEELTHIQEVTDINRHVCDVCGHEFDINPLAEYAESGKYIGEMKVICTECGLIIS